MAEDRNSTGQQEGKEDNRIDDIRPDDGSTPKGVGSEDSDEVRPRATGSDQMARGGPVTKHFPEGGFNSETGEGGGLGSEGAPDPDEIGTGRIPGGAELGPDIGSSDSTTNTGVEEGQLGGGAGAGISSPDDDDEGSSYSTGTGAGGGTGGGERTGGEGGKGTPGESGERGSGAGSKGTGSSNG